VHLWPLSGPVSASLCPFPLHKPPECVKRQILSSLQLVQSTPDTAEQCNGASARDIWSLSLLPLEQCWWLNVSWS